MFRPNIRAGLLFSLLISAGLVMSQAAHAAEAPGGDVQQSSSTSVVVDSTSSGSQPDSATSVTVESKQSSEVGGVQIDSSTDNQPQTTGGSDSADGAKTPASPDVSQSNNDQPGLVDSANQTGVASESNQIQQPKPTLANRLQLAAKPTSNYGVSIPPAVTTQQGGLTTQIPEPNKPHGPSPADSLQRLGSFFEVTLPIAFKGITVPVILTAGIGKGLGLPLLTTVYLFSLILSGYTVLLKRSGFSHGARSDVPANGTWNLFTPQKVSYAWANGPNVSSLFSGVKR